MIVTPDCHTIADAVTLINTFSQDLTQVEEILISAVMPIMSLYRLPQGQYGYTGHVVNLHRMWPPLPRVCHDCLLTWMSLL